MLMLFSYEFFKFQHLIFDQAMTIRNMICSNYHHFLSHILWHVINMVKKNFSCENILKKGIPNSISQLQFLNYSLKWFITSPPNDTFIRKSYYILKLNYQKKIPWEVQLLGKRVVDICQKKPINPIGESLMEIKLHLVPTIVGQISSFCDIHQIKIFNQNYLSKS